MGRRASESAACNLIPKMDYPKTGYMVEIELSVVFIQRTTRFRGSGSVHQIVQRRGRWP
jgi:hypothetical protein